MEHEQLRLETALRRGGWTDFKLTDQQIRLAHDVVKANALNDSDYELLKKELGL